MMINKKEYKMFNIENLKTPTSAFDINKLQPTKIQAFDASVLSALDVNYQDGKYIVFTNGHPLAFDDYAAAKEYIDANYAT